MTIELRVPEVGESITEVTIGDWLKNVGDIVDRDEPGGGGFSGTPGTPSCRRATRCEAPGRHSTTVPRRDADGECNSEHS